MNLFNKFFLPILIIFIFFLIWIKSDIQLSLNFPIILFMIVPFWIYYRFHRYKQHRNFIFTREILKNIFFLYLLIVLYVTLNPFHFSPPGNQGNLNLVPYVQILYQYKYKPPMFWMLYTLGNIIMFVPFGFLFPAIYRRRFKLIVTIMVAALSSLTIELTQYFFTIDRAADIDDLILNMAGAIIGYLFFSLTKKIVDKSKTIIFYFNQ
ncbi:VanZ family protein [Niallia sp. 01092]|uniref:VanZ family protein n=1 Tax=unclassified Niallia TaxID=2837522 RepID=UPI003FD2B1DA